MDWRVCTPGWHARSMAWSGAITNNLMRASLRLESNEVQVWCVNLDACGPNLAALAVHLSSDELERASRFKRPIDRERFLAGRATLRKMLGGYLEQPPANLVIETAAQGKPRISTGPGASDLRFNLSHADGTALFAFSLGREVGVDVEQIRPEFVSNGIAEQYFSAREQQELEDAPSHLRVEAFFRCWTRKEAYIKARGEGLAIPLGSFSVSFKTNEPAMLSSPDSERWRLYSLPTPQGFAGALVVEGAECKILYQNWP